MSAYLTEITIPDSVVSIGCNPFDACDSLDSIIISPEHPVLATIDNVLFEKPTKTLISYPNTYPSESYYIPQGITAIGNYAFSNCTLLTNISVPDSVSPIGEYAFSNCNSLTEISIPNGVSYIGDSAFSGCACLTYITLPESLSSIGDSTFYDCLCSSSEK